MSTDRSRLVSSIRRIVLTDPDLSSALDAWQNRGDQASSTGTGTSDAERDRLCCDGSTSDNPNPGVDTRDTSEGGQEGLNEDDPALLESGPGSLAGVTDCATGEPVCFHGGGFIPPEGWDEPTDPPPDETWQEGYSWNTTESGLHLTPKLWIEECVGPDCCLTCPGGDLEVENTDEFGDPTRYRYTNDCTGVIEGGCSGSSIADRVEDSENTDPVLETHWPEDGCTNLAIKNGSIVGSKYDPENDGSYSKPMSEIELCDGSGNSFFLSPAANGGWKTIDSTKTDGYLYDSQGNKIAHIDGNEYSDPSI